VGYAQRHPITPRHLATLLEGFRIKAKQIRQGADTRKGYLRSDVADAFRRYLPPDPKHPKHRDAAAELAVESGSRPTAVSSRGGHKSREHRYVSNVSGANEE
jgi:Protein of unknown function (DUF3631)